MSALPRARRSRSRTTPEPGGDPDQASGADPMPSSDTPAYPLAPSPAHLAAATALASDLPATTTSDSAAAMLAALSVPKLHVADPQLAETTANEAMYEDLADNRSSSLSELGDASDDNSELTPRPHTAVDPADDDSEAETERLEKTPRKLTRTATSTTIASEHLYERTPSKLAHSRTLEQLEQESAPQSPTIGAEDVLEGDTGLDALASLAESEAASLEHAGKKRKRSSDDSSVVDEPAAEPARKRSSTERSATLNGRQGHAMDSSQQPNVEEELDRADERIAHLARAEAELEESRANVAQEVVSELATVAKLTKPRKGGRRGKRKVEDPGDAIAETVRSTEGPDGDAEGDNDEEDGEEVSKKKTAIDQLHKIEKKFKIFREKLCDEQIAQNERELEMLKQPNCTHPEYLAMVQCIDERRAEKVAYEKQLLAYKRKCLEIRTAAERHQLHSQYFQTVRERREDILSKCNQRIYELQRGRRQLGVEEVEYSLNYTEKRSDQIRQQTAYNLEVSILSGVAKYVGFPAAPDLRPARNSEIDDDFKAMKINRPAPPAYVRPYNRTSAADEAAAEEQFIERTPWANPQHPAHQQVQYHESASGPARTAGPSYATPAGQRHIVDLHAPNGSASTIDMMSNPPSSAAGQGISGTSGRAAHSESPVLQMKRQPNDHSALSETPGSQPRTFAALARESYASNPHMLSSPAGHVEASPGDHDGLSGSLGSRWGARPLNAPPGPPIPGRPEAGRTPLTQRNLGAVSVGNGGGLFGR